MKVLCFALVDPLTSDAEPIIAAGSCANVSEESQTLQSCRMAVVLYRTGIPSAPHNHTP